MFMRILEKLFNRGYSVLSLLFSLRRTSKVQVRVLCFGFDSSVTQRCCILLIVYIHEKVFLKPEKSIIKYTKLTLSLFEAREEFLRMEKNK